jgi:hypothetical protein
MPCFDVSGFTGLSQRTFALYKSNWATFERIFYFDSNVSTQRGTGNMNPTYYTYVNQQERTAYSDGQQLHLYRYPNSNWNNIQKN